MFKKMFGSKKKKPRPGHDVQRWMKENLKEFFGKTSEEKEKFLDLSLGANLKKIEAFEHAVKRYNTASDVPWFDKNLSEQTNKYRKEHTDANGRYDGMFVNLDARTAWPQLWGEEEQEEKKEGKQAQQQSGETKTSSSPTTQTKPYYTVLGVKADATPKDITKAYHELALKYHPDRRGGNEDEFKKLNEAYECLSDAPARAWYDLTGSPPRGGHLKRKTKRRKSRRRRRRKSRRKSRKRKSRRKSRRRRR